MGRVDGKTADEAEASSEEENAEPQEAPADFIEEFAPAAIVIPNYNKEKELKKMEKASLKKKKRKKKKNLKRIRLIKKIISVICAILLFILLIA